MDFGSISRRHLLQGSAALALGSALGLRSAAAADTTIGFIYVGSRDDYGYNQAHAQGAAALKKLPGIEHAITPCEGIASAERIRDRLAAMQGGTIAVGFAGNPQEPSAVRGGPMFEFLFCIDAQLRREGRRERFELVFFNPANEPGARLGPKAVSWLLAEMARRGIATHLGHKLKRFDADRVVTEGGEFRADLILFQPGMTGNAWFDATELPRS